MVTGLCSYVQTSSSSEGSNVNLSIRGKPVGAQVRYTARHYSITGELTCASVAGRKNAFRADGLL
jgi:hypothetical protein